MLETLPKAEGAHYIRCLANLGGEGNSPQNIERDLHKLAEKIYLLGLEPFVSPAEHTARAAEGVVDNPVHMLLPHEWISSISACDAYADMFLLDGEEDALRA